MFLAVLAVPITLIQDQYIVVLKDHVMDRSRHLEELKVNGKMDLLYNYDLPGFKGYAAKMPQVLMDKLVNHPDIDFIEKDRLIRINAVQENSPSWGLPRISSRNLNVTQSYSYPDSAGFGVDGVAELALLPATLSMAALRCRALW